MKKQQRPRLISDYRKVDHLGAVRLDGHAFESRVDYLYANMEALAALDPKFHEPTWGWDMVVKPLALDLLPPKELAKLVSRYAPEAGDFSTLKPEVQKQLMQAAITRLVQVLRQEKAEDAANASQQPHPGGGNPNPVPAAPQRGTAPTAAPKGPTQGAASPPRPPVESPPPQKPLTWNDLSAEEQQQLREDINSGRFQLMEGPPPPGARPIDLSTFPQDVMEAVNKQVRQRAPQVSFNMSPLHEWLKSQKEKNQQEAQRLDRIAGLVEEAPREEWGDEEEDDDFPEWVDEPPDEDHLELETETHSTNTWQGVKSMGHFMGGMGAGGGGALMDLRITPKTPEERMFQVVQEQFGRLAAEPDPSARLPEGDEVWNARKLVQARWKPSLLPFAKQNLARSPENVYFILDTSGSVSHMAKVIASMAAGSLGLVHLYHGSEAHPQISIERFAALHSAKEFKGLGNPYSSQDRVREDSTGERQRVICGPQVPGYEKFRETHRWFEGNLEWWLLHERPPKGARLIFWGDTMSVHFMNPLLLARMVRDYRFTWMTHYPLEEGYEWLKKQGQYFPNNLLTNPAAYSTYEFQKLVAVGLQVIGGAQDPAGLRAALRKVK